MPYDSAWISVDSEPAVTKRLAEDVNVSTGRVNGCRTEESFFDSRQGLQIFSPKYPDRLCSPTCPADCVPEFIVLQGIKLGGGEVHLVSRLIMGGAIPPLLCGPQAGYFTLFSY